MSAPVIIQRIIGGNPETAIQLSNGQFGRLINLPTGWTTIRMGLRYHMTNTGAGLVGTPKFFFGFGHGTTNMIGDATCDHFVGTAFQDTLDFVVGPPVYYQEHNINLWTTAVKVGGALAVASPLATVFNISAGAATGALDRIVTFLTLTKGSPNYTFQGFYNNIITGVDITPTQFLAQMTQAAPALTNHTNGAAQTQAVNEAVNGTLNAVQVYWNRSDANIEICDLAVAVIA